MRRAGRLRHRIRRRLSAGIVARFGVILALAAPSLLGCQAPTKESGLPAFTAIGAGSNLLGEPCRIERAKTDDGGEAAQPFEIYCGEWEQPSARLTRLSTASPLDELATRSPWRTQIDTFAACQPPRSSAVLGDVPALSLDCAIRRGGWSYQAFVARIGETAYFGDTIPAAALVLERSISLLSGHGSREEAGEGPLRPGGPPPRKFGLYSAGDIGTYRQLLHRAQYYNYQGDYAEAEKLYRQALTLLHEREVSTEGGLPYVLMNLALQLSNQERFAEAAAFFAQAEALLPASLDPADEARLISYRAIDLANQKRFQKAGEVARDASTARLRVAERFEPDLARGLQGTPEPAVGIAGKMPPVSNVSPTLTGSGEVALGDLVQSKYLEAAMAVRQNRLAEAATLLAEARAILDRELRVPRRWRPQIDWLQATIAERDGDAEAAERLLLEAVNGFRDQATGSRNEALVLLDLGRIQAAGGRAQVALQSYRSAFQMLKEANDGVRFDDAWPFFSLALAEAERQPEARPGLFAEMFAVGQQIRSTQTSQTIALASARLSASDREVGALIRQLQDTRRRRDALNQALAEARANPATLAPQLQTLEERWRTVTDSIADVERRVQAAAPRYNQIIDAPAPVDAVLAALRPEEGLYQILLGSDHALAFYIDAGGIEAYGVDLSERDAITLATLLRAPFDEVIGAPYRTDKAYELYRRLFQPVAARLSARKHLITVPSGALTGVPFGALLTEPPAAAVTGAAGYTGLAWLAKQQAITLAPSVQSFVSLRMQVRPSQAAKGMIGFGDFIPDRDIETALRARGLPESCRSAIKAVAGMSRLPNSGAELQAVKAALGPARSTIFLGPDFTESRVKHEPLADYRIVYFATHALLPHDFNCWSEPLLLMSGGRSADTTDDGFLVASEIAELSLDADLVVLSACNTAAPDGGAGGESLSGLARAFFYAGARSLLVTHWRIPDQPTQRLMSRLFTLLSSENLTLAEALRRAQSSLIADPETAHLFNWAAFSVVGDGGQRLRPAIVAAAPASAM